MAPSALAAGNPDEDASSKAALRAARAQRFKRELPGNRYKELEEARKLERRQFEERGLITSGRVGLENAIDMRGTCEDMCCEYEREFREFINSIDRFERLPTGRLDHSKAVAAYTRSEAGAGEGDAAVLPSDLRTPSALVRSLDYLFEQVMSIPPPPSSDLPSTPRTALGNSFGFIRDRTKAIRKEFAMQSSWGHSEAIDSIERVARFHILCLRELQEASGPNSDMHQDADQLGRCFVSLRQHYNDRREELRQEVPCSNEPEFQAYMLIFDLNAKTAAIQTSELPSIILDHPLVKLAWEIRRAAQRNFDTQKEGSKGNAELGLNLINRFVKLLKNGRVPYLLACLVEVKLREMRRSALRALQRSYPRLKQDPIRLNENGEIVERRMVLIKTLDTILGCEEQEDEPPAFNDVVEVSKNPDMEAAEVARRFELEVYEHRGEPLGALINLGAYFNDNKDAPFTRRWRSITEKRGTTPFVEIVNGRVGIHIDGSAPIPISRPPAIKKAPSEFKSLTARTSKPSAFSFDKPAAPPTSATSTPAFSFGKPAPTPPPAPSAVQSAAPKPAFSFDFGKSTTPPPSLPPIVTQPLLPQPSGSSKAAEAVPAPKIPTFDFGRPDAPEPSSLELLPKAPVSGRSASAEKMHAPLTFPPTASPPIASGSSAPTPAQAPLFTTPGFFNVPPVGSSSKAPTPPQQQSPKAKSPAVLSERALGKQPQILPSPSQSLRLSKSLTSSTSRRLAVISEAERQRRRRAIPNLATEMIDQVIESFVEELTPDLKKLIAQENARKAYEANVRRRREFIEDVSKRITDLVVEEAVRDIGKQTIIEETKRRWLIRKTIKRWKSWAERVKRERARDRKVREETFDRLARMGLGGDSLSSSMLEGQERRGGGSEMGELSADVELREAVRVNERFYAPSTFLNVIARHVAPLLEDSYPSAVPLSPSASANGDEWEKITYNTIISTATEAGSTSDQVITSWLISKFSPKDEDGGLEYGGCAFGTEVLGRYDEPTARGSTGFVVFEVPRPTEDPSAEQENTADAQDRLTGLIKASLGDSNRYDPILLLVSWQNESLEEISGRLDIEEDLEQFDQVGVLSLEYTDDMEARFEQVLGEVVQEINPKQRVEIPLEDVVGRSSESWLRYMAVLELVIAQRLDDPTTILRSFAAGVEMLNHLPVLAKAALGKKKMSSKSTFDPVVLPSFTTTTANAVEDVAEIIIEYLGKEILDGIDDIALTITPLRHAASAGTVLPIARILASLAFLVFGELRTQSIIVKTFFHSPEMEETTERYINTITDKYAAFVNDQIGIITSLPSPRQRKSISTSSPANTTSQSNSGPGSRGVKRTRDDIPSPSPSASPQNKNVNTESKASKNARLRAAVEEVNKTLEGLERGYLDMDSVMSA